MGNQRLPGFRQFSGVRQGCPLSMLLFALALHPLISFMNNRLNPLDDRLGAHCDDLSLAVTSILSAPTAPASCFWIADRILNLKLNTSKIQCMLNKPESQAAVCDLIRNRVNIFEGIGFVRAVLLLGV